MYSQYIVYSMYASTASWWTYYQCCGTTARAARSRIFYLVLPVVDPEAEPEPGIALGLKGLPCKKNGVYYTEV
jgi:hypothetical protein